MHPLLKFQRLCVYITLSFATVGFNGYLYAVEFNTAVLDVQDRKHIDLSHFSEKGYIMPGGYSLDVIINGQIYEGRYVRFYSPEKSPGKSIACLTPELASKLGFTYSSTKMLKLFHNGECVDYSALIGMEIKASLPKSTLEITIPKSYLEYASDDWDPPARWSDGVNGFIFDYYANIQKINQNQGHQITDLSAHGTTGFNAGAWRFRGDYQASYHDNESTSRDLGWSRYYLYRALPMIQSKLTIGEDYLSSELFDTFRYTGVSLTSDDNMLPPNLRGYAPEIAGVTSSNAKVTVMQGERVLYETNVGTGPFNIQALNSGMKGVLDVKVQEQNGKVQTFQVNADSVSYLTRPGYIRYKLSTGKPTQYGHKFQGPGFVFSEASWGINNTWSLFGGAIISSEYNSSSGGVGHDMGALGTISVDVSTMRASLPHSVSDAKGNAYKISYNKDFDEYSSQFTLTDYRFTESNYLSMDEYLSVTSGNSPSGKSKDLYNISFSKHLEKPDISLYLNYNYHTYWNEADSDRYSLTLSKDFEIGKFKHLNINATVYKSSYWGKNDNGGYLSFTIPFNSSGIASLYLQESGGDISKNLSYSDRINQDSTYQVSTGFTGKNKAVMNGSYSYDGEIANIDTSMGYSDGEYSSVSASVQGGVTVTSSGAALHRVMIPGSTRMFIDADGVDNIPVNAGGYNSYTNHWGKATVADINEYYRTHTSIDIDKLPNEAEAEHSINTGTLTEGAIGYKHFNVVSGEKRWGIIRMPDASFPPFGAEIRNSSGRQVGLATDEGHVYLSGLKDKERLNVYWNGKKQCVLTVPKLMHNNGGHPQKLLLPCVS